MKYTTSFYLGLIGSVLGLLGSLIWLFIGTGFWSGFLQYYVEVLIGDVSLEELYAIGFIVALLQCFVSIAFFIVSLIKSLPKNLESNQRKNGLWLLWIGIGIAVFNVSLVLPCILLVISGIMTLGVKSNKMEA